MYLRTLSATHEGSSVAHSTRNSNRRYDNDDYNDEWRGREKRRERSGEEERRREGRCFQGIVAAAEQAVDFEAPLGTPQMRLQPLASH